MFVACCLVSHVVGNTLQRNELGHFHFIISYRTDTCLGRARWDLRKRTVIH